MLHDAHNHLQDGWLRPHRTEILAELGRIGVAGAVVNGTTEADWPDVAALAAAHTWIVPSFGLHPWFIAQRTGQWKDALIRQIDAAVECGPCGVGEIGLDRWKQPFDFDDQRVVFLWQLALAAGRNLPVTIHCLRAWGALADLLASHPVPSCGFLLHAYGGPAEMVPGFVERGAYFSFNASFLHKRKAAQREVFRHIPDDRLLVETDAPAMPPPAEKIRYPLPPAPDRTIVNHPANLAVAYEALAELRDVSRASLDAVVARNFQRLFAVGLTSAACARAASVLGGAHSHV